MTPKSRLGKKDIFAATTPKKGTKKKKAGSPSSWTSVENKITVILPPDQVDFLDELAMKIRRNTRAKVRRTEIIRAMIAAIQSSELDLTDRGSEEELTEAILEKLS